MTKFFRSLSAALLLVVKSVCAGEYIPGAHKTGQASRLLKIMALCFVLTIDYCCAQTFNTPEVSSFKQEVFRPVSYYTGQANVSIPLTQVQTNEITIPITLNYVGGAGLKAINPYSSAGMGWRVSAGGAITRSKNGIGDEELGANGGTLNGFFNLPPNSVTNNYVKNNVSSYVGTSSNGTKYFSPANEYAPDVFSFSFLGYSGYFIMGYDGQFKIQSQDIVSVTKVNNGNPNMWPGAGNTLTFELTANDGTVFTFGSTPGSMEFSGAAMGSTYQAEAWYITEVKSVNGRVVKFNYQSNYSTSSFIRFTPSTESNGAVINSPVVLDNIDFNGGKVLFTSSVVTQKIVGSWSYPRMINKIELKDSDNNTVSTSDFTYSSWRDDRYYFLDKLVTDGKTHNFGYHSRSDLPTIGSYLGTDYWGFYNGSLEVNYTGTPDRPNWDSQLNATTTDPRRLPSFNHTKLGVLTQITYPTGGVEEYEYELNTYSKKGVLKETGLGYANVLDGPQAAGGLRVSKITLGDMVRKYRYAEQLNSNGDSWMRESSGLLYKTPFIPYFGRSVANALSIDGEPPVVYGKVIESLADGSYTEYTMRTPYDIQDRDDIFNEGTYLTWFSNPFVTGCYNQRAFVGNLGKSSSKSLERGQVSLMKVYNAGYQLKKQVAYTYATDPNKYDQNVAVLNMTNSADQAMSLLGLDFAYRCSLNNSVDFSIFNTYEVYTFPVYLEKEVETLYESGNEIEKTTQYTYNSQKLRSEVSFTNSKGESIKTRIKYPADINTGVYSSMVAKKMLNFPIEQIQLKDNSVTGSGLNTYKAHTNTDINGNPVYYVLDKKYTLGINSPISNPPFTYFDGNSKDSRYLDQDISYDNYSPYGNVRQVTARDGIAISYLWDGLGRYPMANVKGVNYSSISSQDGKSASYSSGSLLSSLQPLAPGALISTYSYKPLVGPSSMADPSGKQTHYIYDNFNRLSEIREDHAGGNLIKSFHYNHASTGGFSGPGISGNPGVSTPSNPGLITSGEQCTTPATLSITANGTEVCLTEPAVQFTLAYNSSCPNGGTIKWLRDGNQVSTVLPFETKIPGSYTATCTVGTCTSAPQTPIILTQKNNCTPSVCSNPRNPETVSNITNGLNYKYFEGVTSPCETNSLAGMTAKRTGSVTNFSPPTPDVNDNIGFEFSGFLDVPTEGEYTLYLNSDDAGAVYIGSQLVVENQGCHGTETERSGTICLKAGKHAIKALLTQGGLGYGIIVKWSGPGVAKEIIPNNRLFKDGSVPTACTGAGTGLRGTYFNTTDFNTPVGLIRIDPTINFSWAGSPGPGVPENFSTRWEGQIEAPETGTYYFKTNNDDGTKVWINNLAPSAFIIDDWGDHGAREAFSSGIQLTACQKYDIKIDFYDSGGGAQSQLFWKYGSQTTYEIVPQTRLYPATVITSNGCVVNKVKIFFRADCCYNRLQGAKIWGSNDGSNWTELYTINADGLPGIWQEFSFPNNTPYNSVKYTAGANGYGELKELEFYNGNTKLTGTYFGDPNNVWEGNPGYSSTSVFDGNTSAMWHGASPGSNNYVGLNLTGCGTTNCSKPTVTKTNGTTVCAANGDQVILTASTSTTGPVTFTWYRGGNSVGTGATHTTSVAGTYTVTVSSGTCVSAASDPFNVEQTSQCGVSTSVTCNGYTFSEGQIIGTAGGGENIIVHFNGNCPSAVSSVNGNPIHFNALPNLSGKTIPDNVLLSCIQWFQYDQPAICSSNPCTTPSKPTITKTNGTTVCAANSQQVILTASTSATGPVTFTWYRGVNSVGTGATHTTSAAGIYTVKVSSVICVSEASDPFNVEQTSQCGENTSVTCNGYTFSEGQIIGTAGGGENIIVHFNGNCPSAVSSVNGNPIHFNALPNLSGKTIPDNVLLSCIQWFQYDQPAICSSNPCTTPSKPTITKTNGTTVCAANGDQVILTASTSATGPVTFTWYRGVNSVGTGATHTTSVAGIYTVKVSSVICVSEASDPFNVEQTSQCGVGPCSVPENPSNTITGLTYKYYEATGVSWCFTNILSTLAPKKTGTVSNFSFSNRDRDYEIGFEFAGYLDVPADGTYTFYLNSDDASAFYIGNKAVVTYEDCHGTDAEQSGTICLTAGKHAIRTLVTQGGGGYGLTLKWSGPGITKQDVPDGRLSSTGSTCNMNLSLDATATTTAGANTTLTASCAGSDCSGATYTWTGTNAGGSSNVTTFTAPSAGTYQYSVTVSKNGCSRTAYLTLTVNAVANPLPLGNGCYTIMAKHSNKFLQPENNSGGARIRQYTGNAQSSHIFQLETIDANSYKISSRTSGKVWAAAGSVDESHVNQNDWSTNDDSKKWIISNWGDDSYKIEPKSALGKVADVEGVSLSDGAGIQLYGSIGGNNQRFNFNPVVCSTPTTCDMNLGLPATATTTAGTNTTLTASCDGADCSGATYAWTGTNAGGNSNVTTFTAPSAGTYQYSVTVSKNGCSRTAYLTLTVDVVANPLPLGNGCYTIKAKHSDKFLQPENNSNGARIRQYAQSSHAFQLETLDANSYKISSRISGKVWTAAGSVDGSLVNQNDWSTNDNSKKWIITNWGDNSYKIEPKSALGKVADVEGVSSSDGAGIQLYAPNEGNNQRFIFTPVICE